MEKTCPRCGKIFECVHSANCWCMTIILNEKAKQFLKSNYKDCLCENCLKEIENERELVE